MVLGTATPSDGAALTAPHRRPGVKKIRTIMKQFGTGGTARVCRCNEGMGNNFFFFLIATP
jgi:hypothetical protein